MRLAIVAVVILCAAPARAQPVPCRVTFIAAPDGVKEVIERWVAAETRCRTSVEIEIVATRSGLALFAREPGGAVHQRIVPDAQTAGVLVVSWIADDSFAAGAPPPPPPAAAPAMVAAPPLAAPASPAPAMVAAPPPLATPAPGASPGLAVAASPPGAEPVAQVAAPIPPPGTSTGRERWLSFAAMGLPVKGQGMGVGFDVDFIRLGGFSLGTGATFSVVERVIGWRLRASDLRAVALVGWTLGGGPWEVRLRAGGGVLATHMAYGPPENGQPLGAQGVVAPTGEASLVLARALDDRWAATFGAAVFATLAKAQHDDSTVPHGPDVMAIAGVRRRL